MDEKYDIFIAYHGNKNTGTENAALGLYNYIENKVKYNGRKIKAYFHPETNRYGRFEDTPLVVARTPLFLLVVDKRIGRNVDGQLLKHKEDGTLSNLFEEVKSFHDSPMYKSMGGDSAAKLFLADDFDFKEAERLHPIFGGTVALQSESDVADWITQFYQKTYPARQYNSYKYLAKSKKDDFIKGIWVSEAEDIWNGTHHEGIGRTLMIYFIIKADSGSEIAVRKLCSLYDSFVSRSGLEESTKEILTRVKRKYLM